MHKLGMASFKKESVGWHFQTENKQDQELTEEMADYFANIIKDFKPLDFSLLNLVPPKADFVSEEEVYSVLVAAKKTSSVPKDFPTTLFKEFLPFLASPSQIIFSQSFTDGIYPTR